VYQRGLPDVSAAAVRATTDVRPAATWILRAGASAHALCKRDYSFQDSAPSSRRDGREWLSGKDRVYHLRR